MTSRRGIGYWAGIATMMALPVVGSQAHADSQALLDDLFETYVQTTPGAGLDTQRRGGLTFGSVIVRNRVVRPNVLSIDPPSFRGGCQGIDLYGGSFSYINKDQLTQALRAIASNAVTYAFTLALEGVCPTCSQKMEKLRDWVQEINKEMRDSCRFGKSLVNATGLDEWHHSRIEAARQKEIAAGTADDAFDFLFNFTSEMQSDTAVGESSAENAVWQAMAASNTASWFGAFGDTELREVLMSVTGSLIKAPTDTAGAPCDDPDGNREYCFRELPSIMTVEHFVNGSEEALIELYTCDEPVECLNPELVERDWPGLKQRIREVLFGPAPTFTGGLVFKIREKTAVLTDAEERFIEAAPIPVYTILRSVAKYPGTVITVGEQLQEIIASQIARNVVFEMITAVRQSFSLGSVQMSAQMRNRLADRVDEFATRQSISSKELDNIATLMQLVEQVSRQIAQQDESNLHQGQLGSTRKQ